MGRDRDVITNRKENKKLSTGTGVRTLFFLLVFTENATSNNISICFGGVLAFAAARFGFDFSGLHAWWSGQGIVF